MTALASKGNVKTSGIALALVVYISASAHAASWEVFDSNSDFVTYIDTSSIVGGPGERESAVFLVNFSKTRATTVDGREIDFLSAVSHDRYTCSSRSFYSKVTLYSGPNASGQVVGSTFFTFTEGERTGDPSSVALNNKTVSFACGTAGAPAPQLFTGKHCVRMPGTWHPGSPGWWEDGQEVCF